MTFKIVSRADIGLDPVVRSSNRSPRPKLFGEPWATVHQVGVTATFATRDTPQTIRDMEARAAKQNKPNMYNYVIDQKQNDLIYEYAGPYQAAHSAGENGEAVGILLLNGNGEPITDLQVQKFRYLIYALQIYSVVSGGVIILPHYQMPGANTSCPKHVLGNRLGELRVPWVVPAPPPPPTPLPSPPAVITPTVLQTIAIEGDGYWSIARRVYGNINVGQNAVTLERANGGMQLKPGAVVAVPGKAVP